MATTNNDADLAQQLIKALDKAIKSGPWQEGVFLQAIGKKLHDMRERFANELAIDEQAFEAKALATAASQIIPSGFIEVYVALYIAEGMNINKWAAAIDALGRHTVSRPVYQSEQDIRSAIHAKAFKQNDAYVTVWVAQSDIMPPLDNNAPLDRYGHTLLVLREGAIKSQNIKYFFHITGEYKLENGALVKQSITNVF